MKRRKKESSVKVNLGTLEFVITKLYAVKEIIFPHKIKFYINGGAAISPAMSRRQIKNVALKICKTALLSVKHRGY